MGAQGHIGSGHEGVTGKGGGMVIRREEEEECLEFLEFLESLCGQRWWRLGWSGGLELCSVEKQAGGIAAHSWDA